MANAPADGRNSELDVSSSFRCDVLIRFFGSAEEGIVQLTTSVGSGVATIVKKLPTTKCCIALAADCNS